MSEDGSADRSGMVSVRFIGFPVALALRSQEHTEALVREFTLLRQQIAGHDDSVPARLVRLVTLITGVSRGMNSDQTARFNQAVRDRTPSLDLVVHVPPIAGPAALEFERLLTEADEFCRRGEHLLTLAADEDVVRFRQWYLGEYARQAAGDDPTPWPDFAG